MLIQLINQFAQQNNLDIASSNQQEEDTLIASYRNALLEALNPLIIRWAEEDVLERCAAVIDLRVNNVPDDQINPIELNLFRDAGVRNTIITDNAREQLTALLQ